MNGPIIHNIALCLYGNAYIYDKYDISDFWNNSANQFCKYVRFVKFKKNIFGKTNNIIFANNPLDWFNILKEERSHLYLWHQGSGRIDERFTAAFVGGSGNWNILSNKESGNEIYTAQWEVGNQNDPDRRIWKVQYGLVGLNKPVPQIGHDYIDSFFNAVKKIADFAYRNDCETFGMRFENALKTIESKGKHLYGYHKDLVPQCYIDHDVNYILDACQSAWVFGGMGSWNDMWFPDEFQKEYEEVSENLYVNVIKTIINSVNEIRLTTAST